MKILNFGSLNIDNVYTVEEFVRPGETVTAQSRTVFAGGKGLNQSLAAARAGADVIHAGAVGSDGGFLIDLLEQSGVLVLPNDAPESLIVQTIRLLAAVRNQLEQMQHKTEKLEAKVADIRIINRAKLLLVQHLQMTETEAHKYIEKQAMNTSMPRRTIAENIIRTYED